MADDIMAVDERLARLEVTVAKGFSEQEGRFTRLEHRFDALERKVDGLNARVDALNGKLDVVSESLESKMQLVLERLDVWTKESRATTAAMQKEWQADRRLMYATLTDHRVRIEALESTARRGASDPSTD
jgi:uncharacterized coiled-coil protein SlyX